MQPSRTAQSVAMGILFLSQDPVFGKLVAAEAVDPTRWFLQPLFGPFGELYKLFDLPFLRTLYQSIENLASPGISLHNALRKCWIEEQALSMISEDCKQIIVLGAGFDTLVYRLHHRFPEVHWWEIDHPATQEVKRQALTGHGHVGDNFRLTAVDFTNQTLADVLDKLPGYDSALTTLFIMEGLLMYLNEIEVKELLGAIHLHSCSGSLILGSLLQPSADGRLVMPGTSPLVALKLQLINEPYRWGIAPADMPGFFEKYGFKSLGLTTDRELIAEYLPEQKSKVSLPGGEYFFKAMQI
jgi:methyltransferase (TIGR00027 family)